MVADIEVDMVAELDVDMVADMEVDMVADMEVNMVSDMVADMEEATITMLFEPKFFQAEPFVSPNFFKPNLNYPGLRIFLALQVCSKCPHFLCYCLPAEVGAAGFV